MRASSRRLETTGEASLRPPSSAKQQQGACACTRSACTRSGRGSQQHAVTRRAVEVPAQGMDSRLPGASGDTVRTLAGTGDTLHYRFHVRNTAKTSPGTVPRSTAQRRRREKLTFLLWQLRAPRGERTCRFGQFACPYPQARGRAAWRCWRCSWVHRPPREAYVAHLVA